MKARPMYTQSSRTRFWTKTYKEEHYKTFVSEAIKGLVSLHSSYLSVQGFSHVINTKNKKLNKLVGGALSACMLTYCTYKNCGSSFYYDPKKNPGAKIP